MELLTGAPNACGILQPFSNNKRTIDLKSPSFAIDIHVLPS
jgi:hypothetical protein